MHLAPKPCAFIVVRLPSLKNDLTMPDQPKSEVIAIDQGLPAAGQRVIVVCREFRLLGYRDEKGIWRGERRPDEVLPPQDSRELLDSDWF